MTLGQLAGALLVGIIPSLLWFFFWTREDTAKPEPRLLLAGCFFAGMVAVILAIPIEHWLAQFASNEDHKYLLWSGAEEMLKFIAVMAVAFFSSYNDEPIDIMIYCIAVALGFSALENTLFVLQPMQFGDLATSIIHGNLRSIGATFVHVVSSALIGFGLAITFYRSRVSKFISWLVFSALAITVHAVFNILITQASGIDTLKVFGWIWGAVVILIVLFEESKVIKPKIVE